MVKDLNDLIFNLEIVGLSLINNIFLGFKSY